ncbi:hypothetical protein Moror_2059 [Moniliophthora roreri MCA 2997]|uniref:Uncharacterized protein n=1 Tax=Moniliophthora roreri (strain MCA 2997) TaxID=1381753 RepID=V2WAE7_MONRO|nr:hypothetical protein Moror_2059 [Moniliophthora roreri MCA 2997]
MAVELESMFGNYNPAYWHNVLYTALSISPLMLLSGASLWSRGVRRHVLTKLWFTFGNNKPTDLFEVENMLWSKILSIVHSGIGAEDALKAFLEEVNAKRHLKPFDLESTRFFDMKAQPQAKVKELCGPTPMLKISILHYFLTSNDIIPSEPSNPTPMRDSQIEAVDKVEEDIVMANLPDADSDLSDMEMVDMAQGSKQMIVNSINTSLHGTT